MAKHVSSKSYKFLTFFISIFWVFLTKIDYRYYKELPLLVVNIVVILNFKVSSIKYTHVSIDH